MAYPPSATSHAPICPGREHVSERVGLPGPEGLVGSETGAVTCEVLFPAPFPSGSSTPAGRAAARHPTVGAAPTGPPRAGTVVAADVSSLPRRCPAPGPHQQVARRPYRAVGASPLLPPAHRVPWRPGPHQPLPNCGALTGAFASPSRWERALTTRGP
jgi:hypothetical protein